MRNQLIIGLAAATLGVAACHKPPQVELPKEPKMHSVLPTVPMPPDPQPLVKQSGTDASQLIIVSPWAPKDVIEYYRKVLSDAPFHLISEAKTGDMTAFYAEQSGPSIWVTVSPNGKEGSQVVIAGAAESDSMPKKLGVPGAIPKAGAPRPVVNQPGAPMGGH